MSAPHCMHQPCFTLKQRSVPGRLCSKTETLENVVCAEEGGTRASDVELLFGYNSSVLVTSQSCSPHPFLCEGGVNCGVDIR